MLASLPLQRMKLWLLGTALAASACGARSSLQVDSEGSGGAPTTAETGGSGGGMSEGGAPVAGSSPRGAAGGGSAGAPPQPAVARAISAGFSSTCVLKDDGTVWCWGANDKGQLGNGTTAQSSVPVQVAGVTSAVAIETGGTAVSGGQGGGVTPFNCAVLRDGDVQCWGALPHAQGALLPVSVPGIHQAVAVAGGYWYACALSRRGSVHCWGKSWPSSQTGLEMNDVEVVPGLQDVTAIAGRGSTFTCAVLEGGSVQCWSPDYGPEPVSVPGIRTTPRGLGVGYRQGACAVSMDGGVQCWSSVSEPPMAVPGVRDAVAVSVGRQHACALLANGTIQCWGETNQGQLGNVPPALNVSGLHDAVAVSAGYAHTCSLSKAGAVSCWGSNADGQLGNGADLTDEAQRSSPTPVRVRGF
jgi:alpha-tubulin suppressor-like RCC1 family protein